MGRYHIHKAFKCRLKLKLLIGIRLREMGSVMTSTKHETNS